MGSIFSRLMAVVAAAGAFAGPATAELRPAGIDGRVFVSTAWLAAHLADPALVVLHVGSPEAYEKAHIPGARLVALEEFAPQRDGLAVEVPAAAVLVDTFGRRGVGDDSSVVLCFEEGKVALATRAWFTLDVLGHGDHAAILDGGLEAWRKNGFEATTKVPRPVCRTLSAKAGRDLVVDAAWVLDHLYTPGVRLVDSRPAKYYTGQDDADGRIARPGHVPGARNLPYAGLFDESRRLLDPEQLAQRFAEAEVEPGQDVVTYCGVGLAASVVHAVGRQLGLEMRMHDSSYQDWGGRRDLPVARSTPR